MYKITAKIDGMMCTMCEAHINETIRTNFDVKKVKSSHKKGETVITSETPITVEELEKCLAPTGYHCIETK